MTKYFAMGWADDKTPSIIPPKQILPNVSANVRAVSVGDIGSFYFTTPWYIDLAENDVVCCIKIGHIHDQIRLLTAVDLLEKEWVSPAGIEVDRIGGNGVVICLSKLEPRCTIYRNLLSIPSVYYWRDGANFLITDNMRLMMDCIPHPQLNEEVLPQHFLYRAVYGGETYVRDVKELLTGEMLTWQRGILNVELKRRISDLQRTEEQMAVNQETAELFFSKLKLVISIYLKNKEDTSATMLSGGVDSSLIQEIINELGNQDFPTYSYILESGAFEYEIGYVKDSIEKLQTQHTFFPISSTQYREMLIKSIDILGQPVPDDVRPCFLALAAFINSIRSHQTTWFHGHIAEGLTGVQHSIEVIQGDKYRSWPIPILKLLGILLLPISHSKSYGALKAAETLSLSKDLDSPAHHLNSVGIYTDWNMMRKCFNKNDISAAFASKRKLVDLHSTSDLFVENMNTLDLLTDEILPGNITRQLGLYHGGEYVFPYGDETSLQAALLYEPMTRYTYQNQVKPILKLALGSRFPIRSLTNPKGWSGIGDDLWGWMREGSFLDMVREIERPGFMTSSDFEIKLQNPDWFTWNMLTLDLFAKSI